MINIADKIDDSRYFWKACSEDGHFKIGLNDDARVEFGEISSVTFSTNKKEIYDGQDFITIESPNTVSDTTVLHSPESGEVVKYHTELLYHPHLINSSDRAKNWIVEISQNEQAFNELASQLVATHVNDQSKLEAHNKG